MVRKAKVTFEQKISAVLDYLEGRKSLGQIASEYNVSKPSVHQWVAVYQSIGEAGLISNRDFSASFQSL